VSWLLSGKGDKWTSRLTAVALVLVFFLAFFLAGRAVFIGSEVFQFILYVIALVFVMLSIVFYDTYRAYNQRQQLIEALKSNTQPLAEKLTSTNVVTVARAMNNDKFSALVDKLDKLIESPEGMTGKARVSMTLGFVVILGIAMIQLSLTSSNLTSSILLYNVTKGSNATLTYAETTNASLLDIIKTIMTIISGAVTAMIGFYFGARTAEQQGTTGTTPPNP